MSISRRRPVPTYPFGHTALLLIDPYNDFLSEAGKLWPQLAGVAARVRLHEHLLALTEAARTAELPICFVPHHRFEPEDLLDWSHPTPYQLQAAQNQLFARGRWGGEWHCDLTPQPGDIVCSEHRNSSGFANTNLDLLLRQKLITHVVLAGVLANTCVETTGKFAAELGYHVTLVWDATAAASEAAMYSAHQINGPTFAHAILSTHEVIARLPRTISRPLPLAQLLSREWCN